MCLKGQVKTGQAGSLQNRPTVRPTTLCSSYLASGSWASLICNFLGILFLAAEKISFRSSWPHFFRVVMVLVMAFLVGRGLFVTLFSNSAARISGYDRGARGGPAWRFISREPIKAPLGVNVPSSTVGRFSSDPHWPDLSDP